MERADGSEARLHKIEGQQSITDVLNRYSQSPDYGDLTSKQKSGVER